MSTESNAPESDAKMDGHADKYNDPRVTISRRGILLGVAVVCFGVAGSALSIWMRKTSLTQTRAFWGADVITALQLAEEVELLRLAGGPDSGEIEPVRLSGMPGLGHLRHTFLDDRSYDWDSVRALADEQSGESETIVIRLTDPTAGRFPETRLAIQLESGWVTVEGTDQEVRLNDRFRNAVPTYLRRVANYEPMRSEVRARKAAETDAEKENAAP